jgi:ketosteroid isomerase-like protein
MADSLAVVERLVAATNAHDVEALVGCFASDYVNTTPVHPERGFLGGEQVRRNWTTIFIAVPDITTRMVATAVDGDRVWSEWEMVGTRRDGTAHEMAGVIIFDVADDQIASARFYLEAVETVSGDVNAAIDRLTTRSAP